MDLPRGPTVQRHRHQLGRDRKCQETQPGSGEGVWDWQDGEKSVTAGELGLSGDTDNDMNWSLLFICMGCTNCEKLREMQNLVMVVDERGVAQNGAYTSDAVNDRVISW